MPSTCERKKKFQALYEAPDNVVHTEFQALYEDPDHVVHTRPIHRPATCPYHTGTPYTFAHPEHTHKHTLKQVGGGEGRKNGGREGGREGGRNRHRNSGIIVD